MSASVSVLAPVQVLARRLSARTNDDGLVDGMPAHADEDEGFGNDLGVGVMGRVTSVRS